MSATAEKTTQMPMFEGYRVSEHRLNFAGNVQLEDPEVIKQMHLKHGAEVVLVVRGTVTARKHRKVTDKEGNDIGLESSSVLTVESITLYDED